MRKRLWLLVVAAAIGCGETNGPDELRGAWTLDASSGCTVALAFTGDRYAGGRICALTSGAAGLQMDRGPFDATGGQITFMPAEQTCRTANPPLSVPFAVSSTSLTLTTATGVLLFRRAPSDPTASGAAEFGCFATDGTFTPQGFAPVP